jgi:hypothetical protein
MSSFVATIKFDSDFEVTEDQLRAAIARAVATKAFAIRGRFTILNVRPSNPVEVPFDLTKR